jgi:hypothetical protein
MIPKITSLKEAIFKVIKRYDKGFSFLGPEFFEAWKRACGEQLSTKLRPFKLERGILYVYVPNSSWMHELQYLKQDILERLSQEFSSIKVKRLYFCLSKE